MFFSFTTDGEGGSGFRGGVGSANFLDDLGDPHMLRIMINFLTEVETGWRTDPMMKVRIYSTHSYQWQTTVFKNKLNQRRG